MRTTKSYIIENYLIPKNSKITLEENLSMAQIRDKSFYTGDKNDNLLKFYDIRKGLLGTPNMQIKLVASTLNDDGSADFIFSAEATPAYGEDYVYKELKDAPSTDKINASDLVTNRSKEYMMCIRLVDFFYLVDYFGLIDDGVFDKEDLDIVIGESMDVKLSCSCPSFVWTGTSYWLTVNNASLMPNSIYPQQWVKHRPDVKVCKHLSTLIRNLGFLIPQMAMSIKKNMKEQGLI